MLRRVPGQPSASAPRPTTLLGDWYANLLFRKPQQLVLCVSERTLLPVIVPAKEFHTLPARLAGAVREVLAALGVAPTLADREHDEMQQYCFGRTESKRILGSLNEFMFELAYVMDARPGESLLQSAFSGQIPVQAHRVQLTSPGYAGVVRIGGHQRSRSSLTTTLDAARMPRNPTRLRQIPWQ